MENSSKLGYSVTKEYESRDVLFSNRKSYYFWKRALDILGSILALVLLLPVFMIIALFITLDSPGPVFFKQKRVGSHFINQPGSERWERKDFYCYKFRSMIHNSDDNVHKAYIQALVSNNLEKMREMEGGESNLHKLSNDKRITKVGKFIRKYSLDELPQFWNVFLGDMSLVGPRPNIPYEVELYPSSYLGRLQAKPGITGLQQITARCTTSLEEQVNLDLKYIENQSIPMDLFILVKTPITIFTQKGI
jgi:lipopolysaccharide/colanic/teichoic acid biosynthesis glycosyltransferase